MNLEITEKERQVLLEALALWERNYKIERSALRANLRQPDWNMATNYAAKNRVEEKLRDITR